MWVAGRPHCLVRSGDRMILVQTSRNASLVKRKETGYTSLLLSPYKASGVEEKILAILPVHKHGTVCTGCGRELHRGQG
jgi:hypothetical protein